MPSLRIGPDAPDAVHIGPDLADKVMSGGVQVWPEPPPPIEYDWSMVVAANRSSAAGVFDADPPLDYVLWQNTFPLGSPIEVYLNDVKVGQQWRAGRNDTNASVGKGYATVRSSAAFQINKNDNVDNVDYLPTWLAVQVGDRFGVRAVT